MDKEMYNKAQAIVDKMEKCVDNAIQQLEKMETDEIIEMASHLTLEQKVIVANALLDDIEKNWEDMFHKIKQQRYAKTYITDASEHCYPK